MLTVGEPSLVIEKTEALGQSWVTSGRVAFPVEGERGGSWVIEFSFRDASSRGDAVRQSLEEAQKLVDALAAVIADLRKTGP